MIHGAQFLVQAFAYSHIGRVREGNEDSFFVADLSERVCRDTNGPMRFASGVHGTLLAVADGMGGAAAGETASRLAVHTQYKEVQNLMERRRGSDLGQLEKILTQAVGSANGSIWEAGRRNHELEGMGTTLTLAFELQGHVLIGQVGDSRAYLARGDGIRQLTRDQSLVARKVSNGELTAAEARRHPERNILLQALGVRPVVEVALRWITPAAGDVLLLCSDGLHSQMESEEIHEILLDSADLEQGGHELVELANRRGGPDNITVVLAQFLSAEAGDLGFASEDEEQSTLFG
jgi:protein phosphatase